MPRLGHKKSRLGCRQCKARHVKCDELKPCSNCARHGVPCSLVTWDPNSQQPSHAAASSSSTSAQKRTGQGSAGVTKTEPTSSTSPSLNIDYVLNPTNAGSHGHPTSGVSEGSSPSSQSDHFPFLSKFVHQKGQSESNRWIRDLELLHHWTIGAGDDLTHREHIRHIMRIEIPKQGVKHTFLMHELLAFAAFHKASQLPDQRAEYYALGIHHQDHTIRGLRERLSNVTPHEAAPLFITSVYLTMTVFAATRFEVESGDLNNGQTFIDGVLNIFHLLQGMGNVLALAYQHVLGSFLGPMFMDQSEILPSQPLLSELQQRLPALISFIETVPDVPEPERKVYLDAINGFQPALHIAMEPRATAREIRFIFYWPMNLHPDFFACLRQRQPGALALISHYAVLLVAAQSKHWFMQNWGDSLIRECYDLLDPQWRSIVEWPMSLTTHTSTLSFLNDEFFKAPGITARGHATSATVGPTPATGDAPFGGHSQTIPPQENQSLPETIPYTQDPSVSQEHKGKHPAMGHGANPSS